MSGPDIAGYATRSYESSTKVQREVVRQVTCPYVWYRPSVSASESGTELAYLLASPVLTCRISELPLTAVRTEHRSAATAQCPSIGQLSLCGADTIAACRRAISVQCLALTSSMSDRWPSTP
eukprot:1074608-Rhodomonas_salina.1